LAVDIERYYRDFGPVVLRRCRRLLRDEEEAVDAMHDTFVRLLRANDRLVHRAPVGLLLQMATRVCLNRLRAAQRHPVGEEDEVLAAIACERDPEERSVARSLLSVLLGREQRSTRVMAVLHFVDGLTLEEVGREVGLGAAAVRRRLRELRTRVAARAQADLLPGVAP
jgi:RNA polymerase sigma-70 factor, ECF subfamily